MTEIIPDFGDFLLKHLLEDIEYGIYATSVDRKIIYWNKSAEKITGYKGEEVVGKACWDNLLKHIDNHGKQLCKEGYCPLHKAMVTQTKTSMPQVIYTRHKNGTRIPTYVMCSPIKDNSGNVVGGLEIFRDATQEVKELELARKIQSQIAANIPQNLQGVEINARYYPADALGGDFYVFIPLSENKIFIVTGDVSGHGVSSALVTSAIKSIIQSVAPEATSSADLATRIQERYLEMDIEDKYVTAAVCLLDTEKGILQYSNAGHCEILLYKAATRKVEVVKQSGLPFGWNLGIPYEELDIRVKPGDKVFLCTDGIYELEGKNGTAFGLERMMEFFEQHAQENMDEFLDDLYKTLFDFRGTVDYQDDITYSLLHLINGG